MTQQRTLARHLARIALVAFVRGTATGLGSCLVHAAAWWITHR